MGIKLRTSIDKDFRTVSGTIRDQMHDAAVAHALMQALSEPPTDNWLATWLRDGSTTDITKLYRLFRQRIIGSAQHLLHTYFGIDQE